ncbi:glycosyltransferase 61 family protein [Lacimonas salitolerans]|uniref:Glycosyltransferase 61 family protein n=1 Tax=Lacimonas salitolerans TaxID=1323750 RepID=A0ABW4EB50_9RHOB
MDTPVTRDIGQGLQADLWGSTVPGGISILVFHGGGGVGGDPTMIAPFVRLLTQDAPATHPISVTVPQYRTLNRDQAGFDDMRADAARALAWVQGQLPDDGQLFVLGASFGGLLALDAVMDAPEPVQTAVTGMILLNPVTDTGPEGFANRVLNPEAHTALSPQIRYAGHPLTGQPRCMIVHGEGDVVVPVASARRFAALWPEGRCSLRTFPRAGHGFFNQPPHDVVVARDVRRFIGLPDDGRLQHAAGPGVQSKPLATPQPGQVAKPAPKGRKLLPDGACLAYGIGAQKAGTSWLFECLSQSADCHNLPTKELHYFDVLNHKGEAGHVTDRLARLRRNIETLTDGVNTDNRRPLRRARILLDQLSIYATKPGDHRPYVEYLLKDYQGQRIICDFTPSYSVLSSDAFAQMDSIGPARFIFVMRDPVERLWSHIRMAVSAKSPKLTDADYETECIQHARDMHARQNLARIPRADYARTMAALEAVVPAERIHYAFYEELFTQGSVDRICAFLGIAPVPVESDKRVNLGRSSSLPPDIAALLEKGLAPQYAAVAARFGDAVPASWRMGKADDGDRAVMAARASRGDSLASKVAGPGNLLSPARDKGQTATGRGTNAARALTPRPLDSLPRIAAAQIGTAPEDAIHFPDLPHGTTKPGWLDPSGAPYVMVLRDAVFYPAHVLAQLARRGAAPAQSDALPQGLSFKDLGLLVAADGSLFPDSFGKSWNVPRVVARQQGRWAAELPAEIDHIEGTWLFAELFYAHFGHTLTDMPARLWPIEAGLVDPRQIDGVLGQGMLGTGPTGAKFPAFARQVLNGIGLIDEQIRFADRPVRIDRLIVPRRIAPYGAMWNPVFSRMMRSAGARIAADASPGDTPRRIWLSRSRLENDNRGGPQLAALDDLMQGHGFTVVHPQEMPFADQVALARGATHMAGPVGSQLHLCAFCARPGAKVLTVAPDYFKLNINDRLLRDIGGSETHFLVPGGRAAGRRPAQGSVAVRQRPEGQLFGACCRVGGGRLRPAGRVKRSGLQFRPDFRRE